MSNRTCYLSAPSYKLQAHTASMIGDFDMARVLKRDIDLPPQELELHLTGKDAHGPWAANIPYGIVYAEDVTSPDHVRVLLEDWTDNNTHILLKSPLSHAAKDSVCVSRAWSVDKEGTLLCTELRLSGRVVVVSHRNARLYIGTESDFDGFVSKAFEPKL